MAVLSSKINIGELRVPIEIQRFVAGTDDYGFVLEEWTTIAKCRCKVEYDDRLAREVFREGAVEATVAKIFTFRYVKGLTAKDRIILKGDVYEIYGINEVDESRRFLKVWARKIWQD